MSTELIVTGCVISPCRAEPEWLIPAVMNTGIGIQLDVLIQVCRHHLYAFGYDPDKMDDVGYPQRMTYAGPVNIATTSRTPIHLRKRTPR